MSFPFICQFRSVFRKFIQISQYFHDTYITIQYIHIILSSHLTLLFINYMQFSSEKIYVEYGNAFVVWEQQ